MSFAYMRLYTGDYLRDTRHLSPTRHGIYLLLLMYCWDQKGPVPLDEQDAAGIANCRSSDEIEGLRYILNRYFVRMEDGWYNKRMTEEVESGESYSKNRSKAGKASAEARRKVAETIREQLSSSRNVPPPQQVFNTCSTHEEHLSPPTPSPEKIKTKSMSAGADDPPGFAAFMRAYPATGGRTKRFLARQAWLKMGLESMAQEVITALARSRSSRKWQEDGGQYIEGAQVWLHARPWVDLLAEQQIAEAERIEQERREAERERLRAAEQAKWGQSA